MSRWLLAVVVVVACRPAAGPSGAGGALGDRRVVHEQDERARLCTALATLHAGSCAPFDAVGSAQLDDCSAVDRLYLAGYDTCLPAGGSPACDAVQACVSAIDAGSAHPIYDGPLRACEAPSPTVPVGVSPDEAAKRYGAHDRTFADSPSSVKQPIEVCGVPEELGYLMRLTCADGSHPFPDRGTAITIGLGPVGPGGRCGRIVEHFVAPCAEHGYDVYMDPYRCAGAPGG